VNRQQTAIVVACAVACAAFGDVTVGASGGGSPTSRTTASASPITDVAAARELVERF
jgi:hypothetical protein